MYHVKYTILKEKLGIEQPTQMPYLDEDITKFDTLISALSSLHSLDKPTEIKSIKAIGEKYSSFNTYSTQQYSNLIDKQIKIHSDFGYAYPWSGLIEELNTQEKPHLLYFGYGSMLSLDSASKTFSDAVVRERRVAIAHGIKRLFNYNMPKEVAKRPMYVGIKNPLDKALLNVIFTGSSLDVVNGYLMKVPLDEIEKLKIREVGYDLRPIAIQLFEGDQIISKTAYTCGSPNKLFNGESLTSNSTFPHHNYYRLCRNAAAEISEEFLQTYLTTTFLADGKTTIEEWENTPGTIDLSIDVVH